MSRISGDEVRKRGGEDVRSVADGAAASVDELELLALFLCQEIMQ